MVAGLLNACVRAVTQKVNGTMGLTLFAPYILLAARAGEQYSPGHARRRGRNRIRTRSAGLGAPNAAFRDAARHRKPTLVEACNPRCFRAQHPSPPLQLRARVESQDAVAVPGPP